MQDTKQSKVKILDKIKKTIDELGQKKNIARIEKSVNQYMDNIVCQIREEVPTLTDSEITLFTFICAGLTTHAICIIMNISYNNVYVKRSRIINKIEASGAVHKDQFIKKFSYKPVKEILTGK